MSAALAIREPGAFLDEDQFGDVLARLQEMRTLIPSATIESLLDMTIYAEALTAIARSREAFELMVQATETRLRAERRLGELEAHWTFPNPETENGRLKERRFGEIPSYCSALADVPDKWFDAALTDLLSRGKACGDRMQAAHSVIWKARLESLQKIDSKVWKAYDGSYYSKHRNGTWTGRYDRLEDLQEWLAQSEERRQLRPRYRRLDVLYARSRRLAADIHNLGGSFKPGDARVSLHEAELLQAKVAELLDAAIRSNV